MMTLLVIMSLTALILKGRMIMFGLTLLFGDDKKVLMGIITVIICVVLWPVVLFREE